MTNCPNCGGELVSKLDVEHEPDAPVEPDGGILVCEDCFMAVDPSEPVEEADPGVTINTPAPEVGPPPAGGDAVLDVVDDPLDHGDEY